VVNGNPSAPDPNPTCPTPNRPLQPSGTAEPPEGADTDEPIQPDKPTDPAASRREQLLEILQPDRLQLPYSVTAQVITAALAEGYTNEQFRSNVLRLIAGAQVQLEPAFISDDEQAGESSPIATHGPAHSIWGTDCLHYHPRAPMAKAMDLELPEFIKAFVPESGLRSGCFWQVTCTSVKELTDGYGHGQTCPLRVMLHKRVMEPWKNNIGRFIGLLPKFPNSIQSAVDLRVGVHCWMLNPGRIKSDEGDLRGVMMAVDMYKTVMSSTNANVTPKGTADHWAINEFFFLLRTTPPKEILGAVSKLQTDDESTALLRDMVTDMDKPEMRFVYKLLLHSHLRRHEYNIIKSTSHKRHDASFADSYTKDLKCHARKLIAFAYENRLFPITLPYPCNDVLYSHHLLLSTHSQYSSSIPLYIYDS
jgi:hypothetical protein